MTHKFHLIATMFITLFAFTACNNDDDKQNIDIEPEEQVIENLHAPNDVIDRQTGEVIEENPFQYFSFAENKTVEGSNADWDIAFKGTTIIVNSGISGNGSAEVALHEGIFEEITEVPANTDFKVDTQESLAIPTGAGNGWYNYNAQNHHITPKPGVVILVKTNSGHYAKLEILSYYKDNPPMSEVDAFTTPTAYYTFRFVLQTNGSVEF